MKAAIILSAILNVALVGLLLGYWLWREDEAAFFVAMNKMTTEERELLMRDALPTIKAAPEKTREYLETLYRNRGVSEQFKDLKTPQLVQELLVGATHDTINTIADRKREEENSIERLKVRRSEFGAVQTEISAMLDRLAGERSDHEKRVKNLEEIAKNTYLQTLINDINKEKKPAALVARLQGTPVDEQIFVLMGCKPSARNALFLALPKDEQEAIKARATNMGSSGEPRVGNGAPTAGPTGGGQ